jgi:DNA-binding transcriptional MerR regulator
MSPHQPGRLLSIGEFAAATQLTAKALRLYDEQRLLPPASVDAANGYRYYRVDQVPVGRLIRTLRGTGLSLAQIGDVVASRDAGAEMLLRQFAQEADRRYAREKRALQSALVSLRPASAGDASAIAEQKRAASTVAIWSFGADRRSFLERFRSAADAANRQLSAVAVAASGQPLCSLVEPLSDEEGPLELVIPVTPPRSVPPGITLRSWPAQRCATVSCDCAPGCLPDLTGMLDALFDWFDQCGHRASGQPALAISTGQTGLHIEAAWAFEVTP